MFRQTLKQSKLVAKYSMFSSKTFDEAMTEKFLKEMNDELPQDLKLHYQEYRDLKFRAINGKATDAEKDKLREYFAFFWSIQPAKKDSLVGMTVTTIITWTIILILASVVIEIFKRALGTIEK